MKIYYKTFGCRVNQIETQSILEKFKSNGFEPSNKEEGADIIFLNTCCVTQKAENEVISYLKKISKIKPGKIIVTGCYATLFSDKILEIDKNILIFPNIEKENIVSIITGKKIEKDFFTVTGFEGRTRAFVKVQDGCDLKCSYCIVPYGRSEIKSKPSGQVISEVKNLIEKGYKEIILSGTRLGKYRCPEKNYTLKDLLSELFAIDGDYRIRFSSMEPMEVTEDLVVFLKNAKEKFCDYFHISIQSASDKILKFMKRPYDSHYLHDTVTLLRENFDKVGIFCDVICGFPLETEEDFEKTYNFISEHNFSGLHVFTFSMRPLVEANKYKDLPYLVKSERAKKMRELDKVLRKKFADFLVGKRLRVLTLKRKGDFILGLSSNFQNIFLDKELKTNFFYEVEVGMDVEGKLIGKI